MRPWTITVGKWSWSSSTATVAQLAVVTELAGDDWRVLSPWSGPRVLSVWLVALIASKTGDLDAAMTVVQAMTVDQLVECLAEPAVPSDAEREG